MDRYVCNLCGRRFTDRPGFEGRYYSEGVILFALRLISQNMLPRDVADTIHEEKRAGVSSRTMQRWVDHYPRLVEAFSKNLEIRGGNAVSVDERRYESKGRARQMAKAMCMAARLILAGDHWPDKPNYGAARFLEKVAGGWAARPCCCSATCMWDTGRGTKTRCGPSPNLPPCTYLMRPSTTST